MYVVKGPGFVRLLVARLSPSCTYTEIKYYSPQNYTVVEETEILTMAFQEPEMGFYHRHVNIAAWGNAEYMSLSNSILSHPRPGYLHEFIF